MIGVIGIFDTREALLRAAVAAKARHVSILTAFSPAYDPEILHAAGAHNSPVSAWTLGGGMAGAIGGLGFTIWTVRQWPLLIVGGKPLVALPPFLIVSFELTILIAACAAAIAFIAAGRAARRIGRAAYNPAVSDARFGLLVACPPAHAPYVGALLAESGAAEWRIV